MTDLSPAAQAVLVATQEEFFTSDELSCHRLAAAALRAVADVVVLQESPYRDQLPGQPGNALDICMTCQRSQRQDTRARLLAIANELDPQP